MLLSVIVPCYNEEAVLDETQKRILQTLESLPDIHFELENLWSKRGRIGWSTVAWKRVSWSTCPAPEDRHRKSQTVLALVSIAVPSTFSKAGNGAAPQCQISGPKSSAQHRQIDGWPDFGQSSAGVGHCGRRLPSYQIVSSSAVTSETHWAARQQYDHRLSGLP